MANADLSFAYGTMLARSRSGAVAVFDAVTDPCFEEVKDLVDDDPRVAALTMRERVDLLYEVLPVTFDADDAGDPFVLAGSPGCPSCGSRVVASFTETDEPVDHQPVPLTHRAWHLLTSTERAAKVRGRLDGLIDVA